MKFIPGCGCCGVGCENCTLPTKDLTLSFVDPFNTLFTLTLEYQTTPVVRWFGQRTFTTSGGTFTANFVFACRDSTNDESLFISDATFGTLVYNYNAVSQSLPIRKKWQSISCSPLLLEYNNAGEAVSIYE
jgi:hypothetical protein